MGGAFRAGRIIMPAVEDEPVVGHRADGLGGFEVVVLEPVGQRRPFAAETSDVYREGFRLSSVGAVGAKYANPPIFGADVDEAARSEEHTSELQSLMRIPYAVFCLK